jgi:hypothetical protein
VEESRALWDEADVQLLLPKLAHHRGELAENISGVEMLPIKGENDCPHPTTLQACAHGGFEERKPVR